MLRFRINNHDSIFTTSDSFFLLNTKQAIQKNGWIAIAYLFLHSVSISIAVVPIR